MDVLEVVSKCTKYAVLGVNNDPNKYGYKIYKRLLDEGFQTFGISKYINELDGKIIYSSLANLPIIPEVVVFVVSAKSGYQYIEECEKLNISYIWLQPGTYDDDFLKVLENKHLTYYTNCILRRLNDLKIS